MVTHNLSHLIVEQKAIASVFLKRYVIVDLFLPKNITDPSGMALLLINDGQNLEEMNLAQMLNQMMHQQLVRPMICAGIHAGHDRRNEYGTADVADYLGRGAKSANYHRFILEELLPFICRQYALESFTEKAFAGFSLGGLTALDMTWKYPQIFSMAGVFSGSLWWRTKSLEAGYNDDTDRIMHQLIREGDYRPGLRFYFTTGSMDETADRNQNGVIDSIDDTLAIIEELKAKGYTGKDIHYINYEDGRHDISTWARSMPAFLLWGWGVKAESLHDQSENR